MTDKLKVMKKCAACRAEKPVSEMKTCMHNQMHNYVCDSKCMSDFYNPPKTVPAVEAAEIDVVAWLNTATGSATAHEVQVADWDDEGEPVMSLMTVAQHRRILAGVNQPSEFYVESDLLRSALGFCGIAAPESDEELGFNSASYAKKVVRKLAKIDRARGVNQHAGSGVPEGWKLVPVEPTAEILGALALDVWPEDVDAGRRLQRLRSTNVVAPVSEIEAAVGKYARMLAAAPLPPSPAAKEDA